MIKVRTMISAAALCALAAPMLVSGSLCVSTPAQGFAVDFTRDMKPPKTVTTGRHSERQAGETADTVMRPRPGLPSIPDNTGTPGVPGAGGVGSAGSRAGAGLGRGSSLNPR